MLEVQQTSTVTALVEDYKSDAYWSTMPQKRFSRLLLAYQHSYTCG